MKNAASFLPFASQSGSAADGLFRFDCVGDAHETVRFLDRTKNACPRSQAMFVVVVMAMNELRRHFVGGDDLKGVLHRRSESIEFYFFDVALSGEVRADTVVIDRIVLLDPDDPGAGRASALETHVAKGRKRASPDNSAFGRPRSLLIARAGIGADRCSFVREPNGQSSETAPKLPAQIPPTKTLPPPTRPISKRPRAILGFMRQPPQSIRCPAKPVGPWAANPGDAAAPDGICLVPS